MELFTATALGKMRTMSGIEHGDVRSLDITARILAANAACPTVSFRLFARVRLAVKQIEQLPLLFGRQRFYIFNYFFQQG